MKAIAKLQQTYFHLSKLLFYFSYLIICSIYICVYRDDDEFVRRREKRLNDIEELKAREKTLNSSRRVSEHLVDQLRGAVSQFRNEIVAVQSEESRYNREIGIFFSLFCFLNMRYFKWNILTWDIYYFVLIRLETEDASWIEKEWCKSIFRLWGLGSNSSWSYSAN